MTPLVGIALGGPCVRPRASAEDARLGEPAWGPAELLRDLELRLGLPRADAPASARVPRWAARIASRGDRRAFYAASFEVDPLGTAATLLTWRDALVDGGWNGEPIASGGDRLDALVALESGDPANATPLGETDRLARVERELEATSRDVRVYDGVTFVEAEDERRVWPRRWQRVFALLEARGARLETLLVERPGAAADTDLGLLQRLFRGEIARPDREARGDGTLLLVRGETPAEAAELSAALLARSGAVAGAVAGGGAGTVVLRGIDPAPLDAALRAHGLPSQGIASASAWRPAMQILPLALELVYEPRDPHRLLELLTLPVGPFQGLVGNLLARAVARQPGIGGQEWRRRKAQLVEILREREAARRREAGEGEARAAALAEAYVRDRLERVETWLEVPGANDDQAPRAALVAAAERVAAWMRRRLADDEGRDVYAGALAQVQELIAALSASDREAYSREDVRRTFDVSVRAPSRYAVTREEVGRAPHVAHPSALLAPCATLLVWGFVGAGERPIATAPFNRAEREALAAAGVALPDPAARLAAESGAWRRALLAARERVVLVAPSSLQGIVTSPHSMWDEICARLGLADEAARERVTLRVTRVLDGAVEQALVATGPVAPLRLPEARAAWEIDPLAPPPADEGTYATALEHLVTCPLRYVLEHRAELTSGAVAQVAKGALLNGGLSHRLVEELVREGAFTLDESAFLERAASVLDALIEREAATLLLPGAAFERAQLRAQILRGVRGLQRELESLGLAIAGVEEEVEASSPLGRLRGRLDLRLQDRAGDPSVLDLKWGASSYDARLRGGRAVQLAAYSRALRGERSDHVPAAYYAIGARRLLTCDPSFGADRAIEGPSLELTWARVERTAARVLEALGRGRVHVAATRAAAPLLDALGVPDSEKDRFFDGTRDAACEGCAYAPICGRAWEALQ